MLRRVEPTGPLVSRDSAHYPAESNKRVAQVLVDSALPQRLRVQLGMEARESPPQNSDTSAPANSSVVGRCRNFTRVGWWSNALVKSNSIVSDFSDFRVLLPYVLLLGVQRGPEGILRA